MAGIRRGVTKIGKGGTLSVSLVVFLSVISVACSANEKILRSGRDTPPPTNAAATETTIEQEIEGMRTAKFTFIYVVRRKDGAPIDAADRSVIGPLTTEADRRVSSDSGKAFVIGLNRPLASEKLLALYDRFAVADYSQSPVGMPEKKANSNK